MTLLATPSATENEHRLKFSIAMYLLGAATGYPGSRSGASAPPLKAPRMPEERQRDLRAGE